MKKNYLYIVPKGLRKSIELSRQTPIVAAIFNIQMWWNSMTIKLI